jgi:hypothetical protein
MNIRIMAQGRGSRWKDDYSYQDHHPEYKQVILINDKLVLIQRTIMQFWDYPQTIVAPGDMLNYLFCFKDYAYYREPVGSLLNGIWQSRKDWKTEREVILLGDVAYSNRAKNIIINDDRPVSIYGRKGSNKVTGKEAKELFGLSIQNLSYEEMGDVLNKLWKGGQGKLWNLLDHLGDSVFVEIDDYTDDVDSIQEYVKFWGSLRKAILEDDYG